MECQAVDCNRPKSCKGFCTKHYDRFRKYGDPYIVHKPGRKKIKRGPRVRVRPLLPTRGDTGHGRWYPLVWFCQQERILEVDEIITAIRNFGDEEIYITIKTA